MGGSYKDRHRRPFIWQDEMAEVKNLFRKVAKVKNSGFTGFSVWKDEPTAETLSRNRLRRRRAQYPLDGNHLNYSESPYEALNHLHNIRGMCSRIQRQDLFVERKKKDYDVDIHPSLIRRPVTALASYVGFDTGDRSSLHRRPSSAPDSTGTPLYYTAPKPTVLYDVTHKCPRYKSYTKGRASSVNSSRSGCSLQSERRCDSSSSISSTTSSVATSSIRNHSASPRVRTETAEVSTSDLFSSDADTSSQKFSGSGLSADQRLSSTFNRPAAAQERSLSKLVSKKPPRYKHQQQQVENSKLLERKDDGVSPGSRGNSSKGTSPTCSTGNSPKGNRCTQAGGIPDSPRSTTTEDALISSTSRPSSAKKDKAKLSERSCGLWALKQQQQHRPQTAETMDASCFEHQKQRPSTSISHPGRRKNREKRDETQALQSRTNHSHESWSAITDPETSGDQGNCGAKSTGDQTSSTGANETDVSTSVATDDDSHILIKHSTDPYADFKTSMMHMINEEGLINKHTELEELFQYYMDLNPVVHHVILKRVITDIRKDIAAAKTPR
ncbi:hypothetical protein R1flu_017455 [Riccia fluitans]|uniref:OVATE domain-containing protein n=1 Tax=Riccia fluitans TaxID=41844 RepID=A0ABD1ZE26_9MARC